MGNRLPVLHTFCRMKLLRLRGRKTAERVLRAGNLWKGRHLLIRWLPGRPRNEPETRRGLFVGTAASARVHRSAVARNRMRRRCREALRRVAGEIPEHPTVQLLLLPRSSSLSCAFADILSDVRAFLRVLPHG